jgi:dolichol-phosphate mannosyltransferase
VCANLAAEYPVRLVVRKNQRGLSSAVIHGMHCAAGTILVVMDADLSHPPERIPDLVSALQSAGADFVIGSRYVPGGSTDEDWGWLRWLNSKVATLLAWPLTAAHDPMAGFFAIRSSTIKSAGKLDPIGYKIGLELLVKAGCRKIAEIPISFRDRLHGHSKLTLTEQINYLRHLLRLYKFKLGRAFCPLQFVLVGGTGMMVDVAAFMMLLHFVPLIASRAMAIGTAMTWNFLLNRRFTFSEARQQPILAQYFLFCLSCLIGGMMNWTVSVRLCSTFAFFDRWKLLAALCGVVAGTTFNYVLSSRVVFAKSSNNTTSA